MEGDGITVADVVDAAEAMGVDTPDWTFRYHVVASTCSSEGTVAGETKHSSTFTVEVMHPRIRYGLSLMGIRRLFPVQEATVPFLSRRLEGPFSPYTSDVCISAATGTGKTLCYVLPIVQKLYHRVVPRIRCIVLVPTRELAIQVQEVFDHFCGHAPQDADLPRTAILKTASLIGQTAFYKEQKLLNATPDIIVCTPGRLVEHYNFVQQEGNESHVTFRFLTWFVIDEADRLLSQQYQDWNAVLHSITEETDVPNLKLAGIGVSHFNQVPLQKILLSATMTKNPKKLARLKLNRPVFFITSARGSHATPSELLHRYISCHEELKPLVLIYLLYQVSLAHTSMRQSNYLNKKVLKTPEIKILIFCSSKDIANRLASLLKLHFVKKKQAYPHTVHIFEELFRISTTQQTSGHSKNDKAKNIDSPSTLRTEAVDGEPIGLCIEEFSGSFTQQFRTKLLQDFKSGKTNCLICTDVAARGLDVSDVDFVISYDAPQHVRTYIHRAGRTARAGRFGCSITLLEKKYRAQFLRLLSKSDIKKQNVKEWIVEKTSLNTLNPHYEMLLKSLEEYLKE